jgi:hypothetical protein
MEVKNKKVLLPSESMSVQKGDAQTLKYIVKKPVYDFFKRAHYSIFAKIDIFYITPQPFLLKLTKQPVYNNVIGMSRPRRATVSLSRRLRVERPSRHCT